MRSWRSPASLRMGAGAVRPGSAVPAVARELVRVDLDTVPRSRTDDELAAGDLQRLGEQVVAHIEEVRELAGPPRRAAVGGTEGDGARAADLAVDLVSHDDLDPEALTQVEDALGRGEASAGRLDADHGGRAAEQFPGHVGGRRGALVGDGGHGRAGGQPA